MLDESFNFLKKLKNKIFPFYRNKELRLVFKVLQDGFSNDTITARFVGGCVRKYLTNEQIDDIDIATILNSEEIKERFKDTKFTVVETGVRHGTITLVSDKLKLEITTLRRDIDTDGRHAKVQYITDWHTDSERRDFTINAIYLDINGNIFDPQMGTVDLKNKNVKFIGDPQKRIEEDYLRILRFIRFKILYGGTVEQSTAQAIKLNIDGIKKISKERILLELFKILKLKNFINLNENRYLKETFTLLFPEFCYLNRLDRLKKILKNTSIENNILLAVLLIDESDNHEYFSHKYNISKEIKETLDQFAKDLRLIKKDKEFFGRDLNKNIYLNNKKYLSNLNIVNYATNLKQKLNDFTDISKKIIKSKNYSFPIDGKYLIENGMKEGLEIGRVLKTIEKEWMENGFKISKDRVQEIIKLYSH